MSEPSDKVGPHYVVCNCQHCEGHIEFNANDFAEENCIVPCPHCGLETKIFIPALQATLLSTQLPPAATPTTSNAVRHEGFFCGTPDLQEEFRDVKNTTTNSDVAKAPIASAADYSKDEMAAKLIKEGEQDVLMSIDTARRYVADPRFKLMNPETGAPFIPATLESFTKSKELQEQTATGELTQQGKKRNVVVLTKTQCENPLAQELIRLLVEIEKEGFSSDTGVRRLNNWLEGKEASNIPAFNFLLKVSHEVLSCGSMPQENAAKMQNAIVRVLPRHIPVAEVNAEEFSEKLPARKSVLKRIRALGGNPPPRITRKEAYQLEQELKTQPSKKQLEYIRILGGKPPPNMTRWEASDLIESLLNSARATEKQLQFIRELGGDSPADISHATATSLIQRLLAEQRLKQAQQNSPTLRQLMVLRFWNKMHLVNSSQWEVEQWLTEFYKQDPRRKDAWENFKKENGDDGSQRDPSWVPVGIGNKYLRE